MALLRRSWNGSIWAVSNNRKAPAKSDFLSQVIIDSSHRIISLKDEKIIFNKLFKFNTNNVLYHYTALDSLLYIIKSNQLKFSGVAGFNDANELRTKSTIIGNGLKFPYNKKRMNIINNRYAFCLSKRRDDLNQWRLYGNDGKGICLGFKLNTSKLNPKKMYAGEVNYGDSIKFLLNNTTEYIKKKWDYSLNINHSSKWGYFIKGKEWEDEQEIRLLLITTKNDKQYTLDSWAINPYGVLYPSILVDLKQSGLQLSSITLGPKCPIPKLNKAQIAILLKTCYPEWGSKPIKLSKITSYR